MSFLTTQEVFDLELLLILGDDNVDGEMCMYESHFVSEALGDTDEHVVDQGFDGGDGTSLLITTVPHLDSDELALHLRGGHFQDFDIECDVTKILGDSSLWTFNSNFSSFNFDGFDLSWDGQVIFLKNGSHVAYIFFY